jgi:Rab-like protein 2
MWTQTYISWVCELSVIWDTAGQESFNSLHPSYYFGADVCILVFDATRKITYTNLAKWYQELRTHCPHIPCILVANKIDGALMT